MQLFVIFQNEKKIEFHIENRIRIQLVWKTKRMGEKMRRHTAMGLTTMVITMQVKIFDTI